MKTQWIIDPAHSEVQFKVKHLMITTVTGSFQKFGAEVETEGDDLGKAHISFWADVDSVTTGNPDRDKHLKSPDFFDIANHPKLLFKGTNAERNDRDDHWTLKGDLTINGITQPVTLDVEWSGVVKDPWGNTKAGVTVNGRLDRSKWKLNWNAALEAGGVLVSDEVRVTCDVQLTKQG